LPTPYPIPPYLVARVVPMAWRYQLGADSRLGKISGKIKHEAVVMTGGRGAMVQQ